MLVTYYCAVSSQFSLESPALSVFIVVLLPKLNGHLNGSVRD